MNFNLRTVFFTARCYVYRQRYCYGKLTVCLSVHLSVTLGYSDHIRWNTSKISRLNSLGSLVSADLTSWIYSKGIVLTPWISAGAGVGYRKSGCLEHKSRISLKRGKIERNLPLAAYIKSCTRYRLVPQCMTTNVLVAVFFNQWIAFVSSYVETL